MGNSHEKTCIPSAEYEVESQESENGDSPAVSSASDSCLFSFEERLWEFRKILQREPNYLALLPQELFAELIKILCWDRLTDPEAPMFLERILSGHVDSVTGCHVVSETGVLLSASADGTIREWQLPTGGLLRTGLYQNHNLWNISMRGRTLATVVRSGELQLWNYDTLNVRECRRLQAQFPSVRVGNGFVVTADFTSVEIRDLNDLDHPRCSEFMPLSSWSMALYENFLFFATCENPHRRTEMAVLCFEIKPPAFSFSTPYKRFLTPALITSVAATSLYVCGGSADGRILIWSFESCELLYNIGTIHTNTIFSVCAAGNVLVSGSNDRSFAVSDIRTGKLVRRVVGAHHAEINCVRIWGNRIITASNDSTLKIWTVG